MPTAPAAVRELLRFGLAALGIHAAAGVKSSDCGVLRWSSNGYAGIQQIVRSEPPRAREPI
jgi:hypothetical protein